MMDRIASCSAITEIAVQCRDGCTNTDWDAAQLALLRDKLAHVVRFDRGNYNGVISEQIKQQTPNHTKVLTARIRRKPSDMVHMLVEVAQLLVYWRHTNSRFGNNSIGAKYDKKMAKRCV